MTNSLPERVEKPTQAELDLCKKYGVLFHSDLKDEGPRIYQVEDVFACGSLGALGGKTGSGKSWIVKPLIAAMVRDREDTWFGWKVRKGRVLWIGFEEDSRSARDPFVKMGITENERHRIVVQDYKSDKWSGGVLGDSLVRNLEPLIIGFGISTVVLDPALDLTSISDINASYTALRRFMLGLKQVAVRTDCFILCLCHTGKGDRRGIDAFTGNTGFSTPIDRALLLRGEDDEPRYLSNVKRRGTFGKPFREFLVLFDEDSYRIGRGSAVTGERDADIRAAIHRELDKLTEEIKQTPLLKLIGVNRDVGRKTLDAMVDEKLIACRGSRPKYYRRLAQPCHENAKSEDVRPGFISVVVGRTLSNSKFPSGVARPTENIVSEDVRPGAGLIADAKGAQPDAIEKEKPRLPIPIASMKRVALEEALTPRTRGRVVHDEEV